MGELLSREDEQAMRADLEHRHSGNRWTKRQQWLSQLLDSLDALRAALHTPEANVEEMVQQSNRYRNDSAGFSEGLRMAALEIEQLRQQLARYSNPWMVKAQNQLTRHWTDVTHDAPLTMAEAETRLAEHKAKSPEAKFRLVPWFSPSQHDHINNLTAEAWDRRNS